MTCPDDALCKCADPKCPECGGLCENDHTTTLYRVDMEDQTGTPMCVPCAEDAYESGVFSDQPA